MEVLWGILMSIAARTGLERGFYTIPEVAYTVDVEDKVVNREVDAKIVLTARQSPSGERLLDRHAVLYLAAIRELRTDLSKEARLRIAELLRAGKKKLMLGPFEVSVSRLSELVRERLSAVDNLRGEVTSDLAVCGGDPVLRGTRIRIHKIADLAAQGMTMAEFRREFDISPDKVELATLFSRLHPRRGRRELPRRDVVEHIPAGR
jgi:uncharacterized protein (DUF433 family)